jgi:cell division protein FtsI (penicillin-binding protein 3)
MATYPTYDPSKSSDPVNFRRNPKTGKLDFKHYNRCISENHEPGSVMKTITACAVLNEGMATADTLINTDRNDPDYYRLPGDGSHKWEPFMSVRDALVHSSNIVFGKLGYKLGPRRLRHYFSEFGFGRKTGIDLPDEESGILPDWKKWDKASWSRAPIGQYVAVTPIQMAVAYGAVANGGKLMKPYIVDRAVSVDGYVLFRNEPTVVGNPITAETARRVREMMLGVARPGGTARRAAVKGYSVAGKTGTAQMREGRGYSRMNYNASFIGMLPASNPSIVILVTYQQPEHCISYKYHEQTGLPLYNHQGGVCAAPVFKRIATEVSQYLGIEPDKPEELIEE